MFLKRTKKCTIYFIEANHKNIDLTTSKEFHKRMDAAGQCLLVSARDYTHREVVNVYWSKLAIDKVFDLSRNYKGMKFLKRRGEETTRGLLVLSFLATAIESLMKLDLKDSKITIKKLLLDMGNLMIHAYQVEKVLEDMTPAQKAVIQQLNLEIPLCLKRPKPSAK
jgi:transposase